MRHSHVCSTNTLVAADADARAACERRALHFGRHVLANAAGVSSVQQLCDLAQAARQAGQLPGGAV